MKTRDPRRKRRAVRKAAKKVAIKRSAATVLKKYSKTFIDLARYDRGERVVSLSR